MLPRRCLRGQGGGPKIFEIGWVTKFLTHSIGGGKKISHLKFAQFLRTPCCYLGYVPDRKFNTFLFSKEGLRVMKPCIVRMYVDKLTGIVAVNMHKQAQIRLAVSALITFQIYLNNNTI